MLLNAFAFLVKIPKYDLSIAENSKRCWAWKCRWYCEHCQKLQKPGSFNKMPKYVLPLKYSQLFIRIALRLVADIEKDKEISFLWNRKCFSSFYKNIEKYFLFHFQFFEHLFLWNVDGLTNKIKLWDSRRTEIKTFLEIFHIFQLVLYF